MSDKLDKAIKDAAKEPVKQERCKPTVVRINKKLLRYKSEDEEWLVFEEREVESR